MLKARKPGVKMIALEPGSPVLSGGQPGPHKIQGISGGFVPAILDRKVIDEIVAISNENRVRNRAQGRAAQSIPVGISSGAAIAAALEGIGARPDLAEQDDRGDHPLASPSAIFRRRCSKGCRLLPLWPPPSLRGEGTTKAMESESETIISTIVCRVL